MCPAAKGWEGILWEVRIKIAWEKIIKGWEGDCTNSRYGQMETGSPQLCVCFAHCCRHQPQEKSLDGVPYVIVHYFHEDRVFISLPDVPHR